MKRIERIRFRAFAYFIKLLDLLHIPVLTRYGFRWFPTLDENSICILYNPEHPEEADLRFITQILRPGDIFIDIGAHHGLYSLLAGLCLRPSGKVISFEPSPRERQRLIRNIAINELKEIIRVEAYALAEKKGETTLFIAPAYESGLNSLRPPKARLSGTIKMSVQTYTLDDYIQEHSIHTIRLIKMDAEGGELSILHGSHYVITQLRPIWLIEVAEVRTEPWGYPAKEIIQFLENHGYQWYIAQKEGLQRFYYTADTNLCSNYIALPEEEVENILAYLQQRPFQGFPLIK